MRIYIGGPQGVGKTSVAELFVERNPSYSRLSGSEIMMKICEVSTRKDLEKIDQKIKERLENERYVLIVMGYDNLLVDGHFRLTPQQKDCFDIFIYVGCTKEKILDLRKKDSRRNRDLDPEKIHADVVKHEKRLEAFKATYPKANLHIIFNDGNIEELVEKIETICKI